MPVLNSKKEIRNAINILDIELSNLNEELKKYETVFG